jgi:branched-chain amino acid transport system ATP-binding protein
MLRVRGLDAWYGKSQVLRGVDLEIAAGEIVALLGRNGAGRSTTLKAIMGAITRAGSIMFDGEEISALAPHEVAWRGLGYVPEDRAIFPGLSVEENLVLGEKADRHGEKRFRLADAYALFPRLAERAKAPADALSGGEQQMLTICRTLLGNPRLLMVDEPTEGLAPMMVERIQKLLARVAELGVTILLVEQKLTIALKLARRLYVMGHGSVVFEGTPAAFASNAKIRQEWLEV